MAITKPDTRGTCRDEAALGERWLMVAMLEDALAVIAGNARRPCDRRLQAEARNWVMAYDPEWPFSFENVCESLGLDPDALRARIPQIEPVGESPQLDRERDSAPRRLRLVS